MIYQMLTSTFMQHAFIGAFLASLACGLIGPFVVVKRIGYIAGGISHAVLGGVGLALFFHQNPMYGAIIFSILAALLIGFVSIHLKQYEDVMISALWSFGMAIGIIFISKTPGYQTDLMSYLFGNILMISIKELYLILGIDLLLILFLVITYKKLISICFDQEFAYVRGVNTSFYYMLLLCMIALTCVVLIQIVGLILVIALLSLPAASIKPQALSIKQMIFYASGIGVLSSFTGLILAYFLNVPAGSMIILVVVMIFFLSVFVRRKKTLPSKVSIS
ncbi:MAG TPA: metal ABC transporter permease [Chlamydiales bacterium]|nr:metal ABC transporter permease [Chlamydiales bacterium]